MQSNNYPDKSNRITSFRGDYHFLSNFFKVPITYQGLTYPSVEHAFQAAKLQDVEMRELFTNPELSASDAKRMGREFPMRVDWNDIRFSVMEELLMIKFQSPKMRHWLLSTGDAELVEGNYWGDTYWGVDMRSGSGFNHLGFLLMKVRDYYRNIQ